MNKRVILPRLCFLLLVSLLAIPVIAATVTCPSSCSCLLPAEAKNLDSSGYCGGKQAICGYDSVKNEKYCFAKTVTTAPQLVVTVVKPVVTTTVTTKPVIAPITTLPVIGSITHPVPAACPDTCACMPDEKAQLATVPLSLCGGTKTYCSDTAAGVSQYCYTLPATVTATTTVTPGLRGRTERCTSGCTCLSTDKADAIGLKRCIGSTLPCDYDPAGNPMQCYVLDRATKVSPLATATETHTPAGGASVPINMPVTGGTSAPSSSGNIIEVITGFFAGLFHMQTASEGVQTMEFTGGIVPVSGGLNCEAGLGLTNCDRTCVDTATDRQNCGRCGTVCYAGEICCGSRCVRNISADNCGSCGNTCSSGSVCQNGICDTWGCYFGTTNCANVCVDLQTDSLNCGSCGNSCPANSRCENGACRICPLGTLFCDGRCVSSNTDRDNCGVCRNACPRSEICSGGACMGCPEGRDPCGNTCVNLQSDNANCGGCGSACPAGTVCGGGRCVCPISGWGYCSGIGSGTCVDIRNDRANCGSCGDTCPADRACCNGRCSDISTDADNCGGCGFACGNRSTGPGFCDRQVCASCPYGTYRCGFGSSAVCQDITSDPYNCGSCGHRCGSGEICCGGTCFDPRTSEQHCGACMNPCLPSQQCCGSGCIDVLFDENNCGQCNHHCTPGKHCYSGRCCSATGINCD